MDIKDVFQKDFFCFDVEGEDFSKVVKKVSVKLLDLDMVEESYLEAVLQRESNYPTGLITQELNIGIPHTDPEHVKSPFVYIVRLKDSIKMKQMGDSQPMDVSNLFFLGITNPADQVQLLQLIMSLFMDAEFVRKFESSNTEEEAYDLFSTKLELEI